MSFTIQAGQGKAHDEKFAGVQYTKKSLGNVLFDLNATKNRGEEHLMVLKAWASGKVEQMTHSTEDGVAVP